MKLYLKRDKSDVQSRYNVFDNLGEQRYKIEGKRTASVERTYILQGDSCVSKLRTTQLGPIRSSFVVTKEMSFHVIITQTRDKFAVSYHGVNVHIRGDVFNNLYDILDVSNTVIACVSRVFKSSSETLELNINDDKYEMLALSTALCLSCVCTTEELLLQAT